MTAWTVSEIEADLNARGLTRFLQLRVVTWDIDARRLTLAMPPREELEGGAQAGHLHGGAIGALADTAATFALLAAGVERAPTANYRLDLLRPVIGSGLTAAATVRKLGRTLALVDVELTDDCGRLAALARASFVVA